MGFFSSIKKLWGGRETSSKPEAPQEPTSTQAEADAHVAATPQPEPKALEPKALEPKAPESKAPESKAVTPQAPASTPPATSDTAWRERLGEALDGSRPHISEWLAALLDGVPGPGEALNERLRFLFDKLGAPAAEAAHFIDDFTTWAGAMHLQDPEAFRSELRYRLILALDLEQEAEERGNIFKKFAAGLAKTKARMAGGLGALFGRAGDMDDAFWDDLEEVFITADVGAEATGKLLANLRKRARAMGVREASRFRDVLAAELEELFPLPKKPKIPAPPEVAMMIGVNGAGKTTTIAKLAYRARLQGRKVLIAAGDTFRAAAIDQLQVWAERVGVGFSAKSEGSDPAAVAYEAVDTAMREDYDLVLLDTAGRLQTKANLMEELRKIKRVLEKKLPGAPHRCVLVIDATMGQNALSQVKLFNEAVGVDEIVLTKLDGTAKGGVMVGVALTYKLPISFVGLGEKMEDLRPFVGEDFAKALLGGER